MDAQVKVLSVKDSPGFNVANLQATHDKVVTFMVGDHGPFILRYHSNEYNQQRVHDDIQKEVDTLRSLNAIQ